MRKLVYLADIDLKSSPPVRAQLREDVVADYAAAYKARATLPLPHLFITKDGKWYLVADGLHRIHAQARLGRKAVEAEIHVGDYDEALKYALTANVQHGLRRSNEDKRQSIISALRLYPTASNNQIAAMAVVDDHTVANVRKEMEEAKVIEPAPTRTGKDGKERKAPQPRNSEVEKQLVDETGYPIPDQLSGLWQRREEFQALHGIILEAHGVICRADGKDPLWAGVHLQEIQLILEKADGLVVSQMPYAVCTACQGHPDVQPGGVCRGCKGRGFIGRYAWNNVAEEIKAVRSKSCG